MNKLLLVTLAFTTGAGIGFLASNKYLELKYEDLLQDEIESIKDAAYDRAIEQNQKELGEYTKMANKYKAGLDVDVDTIMTEESLNVVNMMEEAIMENEEDGLIRKQTFAISEHDFDTSCLTHDKVTVNYYNGDATFTGEDDEVMEDIEGMFGVTDLTMLFQNDNDVAWVRNEILGVDYEILWNDCRYSEWKELVENGRDQG